MKRWHLTLMISIYQDTKNALLAIPALLCSLFYSPQKKSRTIGEVLGIPNIWWLSYRCTSTCIYDDAGFIKGKTTEGTVLVKPGISKDIILERIGQFIHPVEVGYRRVAQSYSIERFNRDISFTIKDELC